MLLGCLEWLQGFVFWCSDYRKGEWFDFGGSKRALIYRQLAGTGRKLSDLDRTCLKAQQDYCREEGGGGGGGGGNYSMLETGAVT